MNNVAYLLPHDVERLIEDEAVKTNLAIINNKKKISQLCISLIEGRTLFKKLSPILFIDIQSKMVGFENDWKEIVKAWRSAMCETAEANFKYKKHKPLAHITCPALGSLSGALW